MAGRAQQEDILMIDSVCLGVAGIAYEFLCVVASEFLRIFDQPVALLRRGVSNVPDVIRLTKKT